MYGINFLNLAASARSPSIKTPKSNSSYHTSTENFDPGLRSRPTVPLDQKLESLVYHFREDKSHENRIEQVRSIVKQLNGPLESVKTIDSLQRFGIDYHFLEEIEDKLHPIHERFQTSSDLFEVSLSFRLLRQAGHLVSSDAFNEFINEKGPFHTKGLLSLYEASYLNMGEDVLYKAKEISSEHLTYRLAYLKPDVARFIRRTLKHPFHKTLTKYNSTYYITHCKEESTTRGILKDLARADFNHVQVVYQRELIEILRWWKGVGLVQDLNFIRDQPLKWYAWSMTVLPDPQFSNCRIELTKVISFVYIIDDIFDVYGSLEELLLFTQAIRKWDASAVETLPGYMQMCYINLYNIINEIARTTYVNHGYNPTNHLKKSWTRLCDAFLNESKWFRSNQAPKADEYLKNAIISSGVYTVVLHAYFLLGQGITEANANFLEANPTLISCPATILRLWDDLGSSKDEKQEGFDGSYVEYLMKEHPEYTRKVAEDLVMKIISSSWENLNKECFSSSHFAPNLVASSINVARMVEVMYSYDDNQNLPALEDYINALLFKRI